MSKRSRRKKLKRLMTGNGGYPESVQEEPATSVSHPAHTSHRTHERTSPYSGIKGFYDKNYKKLLIIPFILLFLAILQIGIQTAVTGDFMIKGVSLKGGITITIPEHGGDMSVELATALEERFSDMDITVRTITISGESSGLIVEADAEEAEVDAFVSVITQTLNIEPGDYNIEQMGSSLGASFFKETFKAIIIAFLFMGVVVFLYFGDSTSTKILVSVLTIVAVILIYSAKGTISYLIALALGIVILGLYLKYSMPSFAVVLAAVSDIVTTVAIANIFGIKISTAGIAALLMLIGYSVDTDILLSTRVIKRKAGTVFERVLGSMRTGLTMTFTTMTAATIGILASKSDVLTQIMTILLIGLAVDLVYTWLQNVGLIRIYMEKKNEQ